MDPVGKTSVDEKEFDDVKPKGWRNPFNIQQRKEERQRRRKKCARLIVRNISYKATEEALQQHFNQWGTVEELTLLKNSQGKLVGCAFVQYVTVNQATKAILKGNEKVFLGRSLYIDWAVSKDEYVAKKKEAQEFHGEKPKVEEKDEKAEENCLAEEQSVKEESDSTEGSGEDESVESEEESDEEEDGSDSADEDKDEEKYESDEDKKSVKSKLDISKVKKEKHVSNDVQEGCTVFIKNVPFEAEDADVRKVCRKFGPVYYAIVNRESISGHSRGTAFVKFKAKESADLCLQAGTEFLLLDQVLDPCPALSRDEIQSKLVDKTKEGESKDSRNLYLAREGLIMAGSKAADDVSASDMAKRHKLEQIKTQVLKNLNRFISRNRLSIHNLPLNYDNEKLQQMITVKTGFKPHECRVMRESRITPEHPKGKSKGFGFMSFSTHQQALAALRKLNNNPTVFGTQHRPIVAFSIEDRAVHKIKEKRTQKSKVSNPTFQKKMEERKELRKLKVQGKLRKPPKGPQTDDKERLKNHIKQLEESRAAKAKAVQTNKAVEYDDFVGTAAKPGAATRMRSNKKIAEQALEHKKRVKTTKRKQKQAKIRQMHLAERKAVERPKQGRKVERDDLVHLVNKYKRMIDNTVSGSAADQAVKTKKPKRSKWYPE